MFDITRAQRALREARLTTGLTQRDVAEAVGTSQSAIASLESGDTNPTIDTLVRYATAIGFTLRVTITPAAPPDPVVGRYKRDVDRTLLRENLRRSVDERLRTLAGWQADAQKLESAAAQAKRAASKPSGRAR
ncbi:MAG: helix-turn-helix domain-containing protein [Gemmatimonadaceae bacterium]